MSDGSEHGAGHESAGNSIDKTVDEFIASATAFAHAFVIVGLTPWRAGRLVRGKKPVVRHSATFLFVSSFILSLSLSALVDIFMIKGMSFDDLPNIAMTQIQSALRPDILQITLSLFPALICADLSARLLSRMVARNPSTQNEMRRFALLAFAIHALAISFLVVGLLLLGPIILGIALGEALGGVKPHGWESLLSGFLDYLPLIVPVALALHFPIVMWFGSKAVSARGESAPKPAGGVRVLVRARGAMLVVAIMYPLLFAIYAAASCLPQIIIAYLEPSTPKGVGVYLADPPYLAKGSTNAQLTFLLENHTTQAIPFEKTARVYYIFTAGEEHRSFNAVDATVVDWEGGAAPVMVIPAGQSRWITLKGDVPAGACTEGGSGYVSVWIEKLDGRVGVRDDSPKSEEKPLC